MKVLLAAQVLINTVGTALRRHYPNGEGDETAKLVRWSISFLTVSIPDQLQSIQESEISVWHHTAMLMTGGLSGYKMYSLHISMTGTSELQNVQAHLQKMTGERCLSHSKHTKA